MLRTARWVTGSFLRDMVLFTLLFAWLAQLLTPFAEATMIPEVSPFLFYLGLLFVVDLAVSSLIGKMILKLLLVILFTYDSYYSAYSMTDWTWFEHFVLDQYYGILSLGTSEMEMIAESARTAWFLVILWMFQSTVRYSLRSRIGFFGLLLLGTIGLGVLNTFFVEDASLQTVMFLLLGLLVLAFIQLPAIERVARMPVRMHGWPLEWLVWTLVLSLSMVGVGAAAPKKEDPSWPDPVAFLENKYGDAAGVQKIGYGNNDTKLGGPFEMDDTVVFQVITNGNGYYRGEAKPTYTGKGWVSGSMGRPISDPKSLTSYQTLEQTTLETKAVKQTYLFQESMVPVLFNQYRITGVTDTRRQNTDRLRYSDVDNRIDVGQISPGDQYTVLSQIPLWEEAKLKEGKIPVRTPALSPYLQLPQKLPRRVYDLARQITQDEATPYEMAAAIESYLRSNYNYEIEEVGVPKEGQDYVDQFLFETLKGYCDNFSSAMVVMARTLGIPARWVKGFTQGDADFTYETEVEDEYRYIVRNRNAHSWPELYFEGVGWVAFEPTASFSMQREVKKEEQEAIAPIPLPSEKKGQLEEEEATGTTTSGSSFFSNINWESVGIWLGALAGLGLLLAFFNRRKLLTAYFLRKSYSEEGDVALHAILRLIAILEKLGWKRPSYMTVREYAENLAGRTDLRGREMIPLAKIFEKSRYGGTAPGPQEKRELHDLWSRLVRKAGRMNKK